MFSFRSSHSSIVGLDMGSTSIKVVELRQAGKGWQLHRIGAKSMPPKAMASGKIKDKDAVVLAIRELWSETRLSNKRTAISVGGPSVIIKKISVPLMTELDLEDQISLEAEEHIPFDIDDVYLDFQILSQGTENMEIMLTACKKELVDNRLETLQAAGLEALLCDVDLFCVSNAFETFCQPKQSKKSIRKARPSPSADDKKLEPIDTTLLVNIGAANLNLAIIANGMPDFTRDHAFGGDRIIQEIMQQMDTSSEEAELLITQGKDSRNRPWSQESREQIMLPFVDQLGGLIRQSLEFYQASHANQRVTEVFVSGGCAIMSDLTPQLHTYLNLPVQTANPLAGVHGEISANLRPTSPKFMVAMGLALRGASL